MLGVIVRRFPFAPRVLVKLGLVGGVLIAGLLIGRLAVRLRQPELLLAAWVVPMVVLWTYRGVRVEYGILAIVLVAATVRFTLPTGTQSRIVMSMVVTVGVVVLWIVRMLVVDKKLQLKPAPTNVPLMGFIIACVISYFWGNAFRDPLVVTWRTWPFVQLGGLAVMILLPSAFLLTANSISEVRWLKLLCWSMILVGVLSLVSYFLHIRLSFLNTGGLFSLWFVSLTYAQALFNKKFPPWLRLSLLGLVLVWMYVYFIVHVTWLSGWLPPLAALATISLAKSKRLFLIFVLLMAIYVGLNWDYYTGTVLERESAESGYTRLDAWEHNWQVTGKHLLFGTGPAGYAAYYMSYFPSEAMATHSNYIDVLSQTGIMGLFFCLWFFGALGWMGYKLHQRLRGRADFGEGFANATLAGCVGCIMAMGLGDWLFPFVYTQTIAGFDYAVYSWVMLGGIVSLTNMHVRRDG